MEQDSIFFVYKIDLKNPHLWRLWVLIVDNNILLFCTNLRSELKVSTPGPSKKSLIPLGEKTAPFDQTRWQDGRIGRSTYHVNYLRLCAFRYMYTQNTQRLSKHDAGARSSCDRIASWIHAAYLCRCCIKFGEFGKYGAAPNFPGNYVLVFIVSSQAYAHDY